MSRHLILVHQIFINARRYESVISTTTEVSDPLKNLIRVPCMLELAPRKMDLRIFTPEQQILRVLVSGKQSKRSKLIIVYYQLSYCPLTNSKHSELYHIELTPYDILSGVLKEKNIIAAHMTRIL